MFDWFRKLVVMVKMVMIMVIATVNLVL